MELSGRPLKGIIEHDLNAQGNKEKHGNDEERNEDTKRIQWDL